MAYSPDSAYFAVGLDNDKVIIYDSETKAVVHSYTAGDKARALEFNSDSNILAVGYNGGLELIDLDNSFNT